MPYKIIALRDTFTQRLKDNYGAVWMEFLSTIRGDKTTMGRHLTILVPRINDKPLSNRSKQDIVALFTHYWGTPVSVGQNTVSSWHRGEISTEFTIQF
jgi:hypothetical protein